MGEWEYLFVTLKQYKPGAQAYIDTVNDEPLPDRYKPAFEFFNEKGKEHWEAVESFIGATPKQGHPTFVFKRLAIGNEIALHSPAASVAAVSSLFGGLRGKTF